MEKHVTAVGTLFIAYGVLGLLGALVALVSIAGGGFISGDVQAIAITTTVGSIIAGFIILTSLPALIGGIGLLGFRSWARILVLILAFMNLPGIPIGTALGIYSIWVLLNDETARLFTARQAAIRPSNWDET